ncbi:MAG: hypothetical protein A2Y03_00495 [Omnitrophica WOR_2 bacterium GWF2_38_59]|nr:MAG: hypothetical protein A2Y03_00495 [Omnitrophica WOR_2 bacterium GWF2_38_59]OGX49543.1 MAG: hypothetical protein A2243_10710 [Omnitrophica WOR_2 bacterium RIFOXYA2_FULL_38_17]OGX58739.1 MAG: hypothetical protein A2306_12335 [Omnitrophica WOR_2 bacterium RIFOXYB2_FULL_38_16]
MVQSLTRNRIKFWKNQFLQGLLYQRKELEWYLDLTLCLNQLQNKTKDKGADDYMRKELLQQYERKLIHELSCSADGIGEVVAGAVAGYFDDLQEFLNAESLEFLKIINRKGRRLLDDRKISGLMVVKNEIVKGLPVTETWIDFLAKQFIRRQVQTLNKMEFDNLDINPLLARALALKSPEEIIRFNLYQSITRSVVTSWGNMVERMLMFSGCELEGIKIGIKGREPDLVKKRDGKIHCFQIKSGPNTMNVDMIESLNKVIEAVEKNGHLGWLGMTYGRKNRISAQILGNLKDVGTKSKIGRELWDFISETKDYHKKVIKIIDDSTKKELKTSFIVLIETKIKDFTNQWNDKFSNKDLNAVLEEYL